jgi:hypothetical protein
MPQLITLDHDGALVTQGEWPEKFITDEALRTIAADTVVGQEVTIDRVRHRLGHYRARVNAHEVWDIS